MPVDKKVIKIYITLLSIFRICTAFFGSATTRFIKSENNKLLLCQTGISLLLSYFCRLIFCLMETLELKGKVHDESRQGEPFAPFVVEPNIYKKKFYIESYGCAMNFADSEIVASILSNEGFGATKHFEEADLIMFCAAEISWLFSWFSETV